MIRDWVKPYGRQEGIALRLPEPVRPGIYEVHEDAMEELLRMSGFIPNSEAPPGLADAPTINPHWASD